MLGKVRKSALNQKGFSLVELMIVVAIIGMLAAVGIPQYAKFQAKARQSEAKAALASGFNAMKSFQSEWNWYTWDIKNAGLGVEGKNLRYYTGFGIPAAVCANPGAGYQGPPEQTIANQAALATNTTWSNGTLVVAASGATWHNQVPTSNQFAAASAAGTYFTDSCTQNTFKMVSIGDVRNNPAGIDFAPAVFNAAPLVAGAFYDTWSIDDVKNLKLERQGF